jgi:hypothetical protein
MLLVVAAWAEAAAAAPPARVVVKLQQPPAGGAHGLLVAGAGSTVGHDRALRSLLRGRVANAAIAQTPGEPQIRLGGNGDVTVYVVLPREERRPNDRRYPIAIVGGGYEGILTSTSTRLPGLVSIADVAPTVRALEAGRAPILSSRPAADAQAELQALDRRLHDVRASRGVANALVIALVVAFALLRRGRAALLAAPAAIAAALVLSALGVTSSWAVGLAIVAAALAASHLPLVPATAAFLVAYLGVLVWSPETNALAAIGAQPDGGGRFYGVTNQVETLLLAPTLAAASLLSLPLLVPFALLALVTVGWSEAGADGGGVLVLGAAFALLALHARGRVDRRSLALAGAAVVVVGAALVALDAAAGGSSHVTRALTEGTIFTDLERRARLSWALASGSVQGALVTVGGLVVVAALWLRRPRFAAGDAFALALLVSLVANDAPRKVALYGALGAVALWSWHASLRRD